MRESTTTIVRRWRKIVPHQWKDWKQNDFRLCESFLLDVTAELEVAEAQLAAVRKGLADIKYDAHPCDSITKNHVIALQKTIGEP